MGKDSWGELRRALEEAGHWGPLAGECWYPTDGTSPMPGVCLRCYVLTAPDREQFKRRVKIVEFLLEWGDENG